MTRRGAVVALAVAAAFVGAGLVGARFGVGPLSEWLGGPVGGGAQDPPTAPPTGATAATRTYAFRWVGAESDLPWNRSLWITLEKDGRAQPPFPAVYFEGAGDSVPVEGVPGTRWSLHSEASPNRVIESLLWTVRAAGTFGEATTIPVAPPRRALVRLTGDEATDPGEDLLTVADEEGGARLVAARRPLQALRLAVWDASQPAAKQDWRFWTTIAPPRPWVFDEVRPGAKLVLAAKCPGKQWVAARTTLRGGEETVLDVSEAPPGGGTVTCDDSDAELLLHGDLPIPPMRLDQDFYRAVWRNVPPGRHAVRLPGGRRTEIEVADGSDLHLGSGLNK